MRRKWQRAELWGSWLLFCYVVGFLFVVHLRGQSDIERRLQEQESIHADRRLSVVETRLDAIEFLGRGILIAIAGQIVLQGLNLRNRRER